MTSNTTAPAAPALSFNTDDAQCIAKLTALLMVRFPDAEWCELEADGRLFALISQGAESRGGRLALPVQQMAEGAAWEVVCDEVQLVADAVSAGRAALEAGLEVGFQMLIGAA